MFEPLKLPDFLLLQFWATIVNMLKHKRKYTPIMTQFSVSHYVENNPKRRYHEITVHKALLDRGDVKTIWTYSQIAKLVFTKLFDQTSSNHVNGTCI